MALALVVATAMTVSLQAQRPAPAEGSSTPETTDVRSTDPQVPAASA